MTQNETESAVPELRDHFVERRIFIGDDVLIIEKVDQVNLLQSVLKRGRSRAGKTWERWAHEDYQYYSARQVLKNGSRRFNVLRKYRSRRSWYFENVSAHPPLNTNEVDKELRAAIVRVHERTIGPVPERFGALSLQHMVTALAYPALAEAEFRTTPVWRDAAIASLAHDLPRGLGPAYRVADARVMTEKLFGKRRTRKDLVKAVARSTPAHHAVAHAFRNYAPVDWLVEYMNTTGEGKRSVDVRNPVCFEILAIIDLPSRRSLLLDTFESGPYDTRTMRAITDTHKMVTLIREVNLDDSWITPAVRKAKTWVALHDEIARIHRTLNFDDRPIKQDLMCKTLDGFEVDGGITITSAKSTADLIAWGEAMSTCIGSYGRAALNHDSYLFAIHREGVLLANMEIAPDGTIQQLYGRFNTPLDEETDKAIDDAVAAKLSAAGIFTAQPLAA